MVSNGAEQGVLLVNPNWRQLEAPFEHLGLGYLAACLRQAGIHTTILDLPLTGGDLQTVVQAVQQGNYALVGCSLTFQESAAETLDFITELKAATTVKIAVGGIYPTFAAREIMTLCPAIDFVVKGEGEITLVELAQAILSGGSVRGVAVLVGRSGSELWETEDRPSIDDLDLLPEPARDTLPQVLAQTGYASVLTSRGCYGRCTFCSVGAFFARFGSKYRQRSADAVIAELERLQTEYGVTNFAFIDANFIGTKGRGQARARQIAETIIAKGWQIKFSIECRVNDVEPELFALLKKAGLCKVFLGVESGSQAVLDRFQKDVTVAENLAALKILSDLDIFVAMGFIMFDDQTTFDDLTANMQFLQQVKTVTGRPYLAKVDPASKVLPLAGTKIEARLKAEERYGGNTLNFSYQIADPLVEKVYQVIRAAAAVRRRFRSLRGRSAYHEFDWQTGKIKD